MIFKWKPGGEEVKERSKFTTDTGTGAEHHVTCLNAPANFCNDLYQPFQGVRYAKNAQNELLAPFFRGSGLTLSQIATVKAIKYLKI